MYFSFRRSVHICCGIIFGYRKQQLIIFLCSFTYLLWELRIIKDRTTMKSKMKFFDCASVLLVLFGVTINDLNLTSEEWICVWLKMLGYRRWKKTVIFSPPARWGLLDFKRWWPPPPSLLPPSSSSSFSPDLNCQLEIAVGLARPQAARFGHCGFAGPQRLEKISERMWERMPDKMPVCCCASVGRCHSMIDLLWSIKLNKTVDILLMSLHVASEDVSAWLLCCGHWHWLSTMLSSKLHKTHDIFLMSLHVLMTCVVHDNTAACVSDNTCVERTCRPAMIW